MTFSSLTGRRKAFDRKLLVALALIVHAASAQANTTKAPVVDGAARNEAIVREAFEGWAAGRGNVFALLAPDIRWTIHGSGPVARTYVGVDDFVQNGSGPLVSRLAGPLKPQLHHIWASEDWVTIRFDASAVTTSGATYRNQFVWIFRMENQSVVEAEAFLDLVAYQDVVDNNEPHQP